tara:strand:- start:1205 stop:2284 length:1080 start_codon:yes stop_codon:yes gene_type:complete
LNTISKTKVEDTEEFIKFLEFSKEVGLDSSMVQAAGGNTSIKLGDTMWVKASGKWLMNACSEEIMVPVKTSKVKSILKNEGPNDEELINKTICDDSNTNLRPSVETPLHAALDFKYVLHTHDVNIISFAILKNSKIKLDELLRGFKWKFIPYIKPGIELSKLLLQIKSREDNVFILQNHGLIVCGDDLDEIKKLNLKIRDCLQNELNKNIIIKSEDNNNFEINLNNTQYKILNEDYAFDLANNKSWLKKISLGAFLPDVLIFLGPKILQIKPDEKKLSFKLNKLSKLSLPFNSCIILSGYGVIIRKDSLNGTIEMIKLLYELMHRVPEEEELEYFNDGQVLSLLNWEAEHYRQKINQIY